MLNLWRYNAITGFWRLVRECNNENAEAWLLIFQTDEPDARFVLCKRRPK